MKKKVGIHACWLDKDCRKHGVPAFTYFFCWWFTMRINPFHDRLLDKVAADRGLKPRIYWRDAIQFWWNK